MIYETSLSQVAVVIPVHNRKAKTLRCLECLTAVKRVGFGMQVIVVDDGSTDGTSEAVKHQFPLVHVVHGSGELYWTAAVNRGIKVALEFGCDWILILNDDTVHDPEFLGHLVCCAKEHPNAIIGAKILYLSRPSTIRFAGAQFAPRKLGWHYPADGSPADSLGLAPFNVSSINGNCCLIPRTVFVRYGLYDEKNFPHCYADTVFTASLRRAGVALLIAPQACVWDDDSDVAEKLESPPVRGVNLLRYVFLSKSSAFYLRAFFLFYWLGSPSKIWGLLLFLHRLARISSMLLLTIAGVRPLYSVRPSAPEHESEHLESRLRSSND